MRGPFGIVGRQTGRGKRILIVDGTNTEGRVGAFITGGEGVF